MAIDDHVELLADDSDAGHAQQGSEQKTRLSRRVSVALLVLGCVAFAALWSSSAVRNPMRFSVADAMSAEAPANAKFWRWNFDPFVDDPIPGFCVNKWDVVPWPKLHTDVNWPGHCENNEEYRECGDKVIDKYAGDYFDAVLEDLANRPDWYDAFIPGEAEQARWKARFQKAIRDLSKRVTPTVGTPAATEKPAAWAPKTGEFGEYGALCAAFYKYRPVVTSNMAWLPQCRANHRTFADFDGAIGTKLPSTWDNLCSNAGEECETDWIPADAHFPSMLASDTAPSMAKCRYLLTRKLKGADGLDWVQAPLTALEFRMCMAGRDVPDTPLSRTWVSSCIPDAPQGAPRTAGWPGWTYQFIREYGIPEQSCVPDYDRPIRGAACPALCDDESSLAGRLRFGGGRLRFDSCNADKFEYTVIFNKVLGTPGSNRYQDLTHTMHEQAKTHIYKNGPIVGLILRTYEFAACARDDVIVYALSGQDREFWGDQSQCRDKWDGDADYFHSVVVHGWGQTDREGRYYTVLSTALDVDESVDVRVEECGLKMFVIPPPLPVNPFEESFWNPAYQAYSALAACERPADFCVGFGAGYTDTEDCDGDGVLDHWCYNAQSSPSYEAFVSSRYNCELKEESCKTRSVLPGKRIACQRPLGWCMTGENYRRNVDCDGDGNFDHVCTSNVDGHEGFISSSQDCLDTWGEGTMGRKCDATVNLQASDTPAFKIVVEEGACKNVGNYCVKSHEGWPNVDYEPNSMCRMRIEWANAPKETGCTTPNPAEEALYVEIGALDIEEPRFAANGQQILGDLLKVGSTIVHDKDSTMLREGRVSVKDGDVISWSSDWSVQKQGFVVCLRARKPVPTTYAASCQEIGDDLWNRFDVYNKDSMRIECPSTVDCTPECALTFGAYLDEFVLTTNVCDAGWHVTRSKKFTLTFLRQDSNEEGRFRIEP